MPETIAEIILRLRTKAGIDAKTLSRMAGLGETYVGDLERGRVGSPTVEKLRKIAAALRVPFLTLVGEPTGFGEDAQRFDIPAPTSDLAAEFAATQTRVAAHLRRARQRYTQSDIARHSLAVWHQVQDLPARMSFADRLDFVMSEFASAHPAAADCE